MNKLSKRQKSSPTDKVPGGLGQFTSPNDVDSKELEKGIEVEHEHTPNSDIAQDIVLDHLSEISDYYTRLEKMEEGAKEDGKFKEVEKVCNLIASLIKVANELDKIGSYDEADKIDELIREASVAHTNTLIKALKENNLEVAMKIMSHVSASELQLTDDEFRSLARFIWNSDLEGARELLGVIKGNPDASLGRPSISPHLKDIFTSDKEDVVTVREIVEGKFNGLFTNNKRG